MTSQSSGGDMVADKLRDLASTLREKAAQDDSETMVKCAQTLLAAQALGQLRAKVTDGR